MFYGVCAEDATTTTAELSVSHFQKTGKVPRSRRELIEQYYGEYIEKADIFIGFEKFNVFDYPMLGWGEESLYYTVAPSLYMNSRQLKNILYDYVYLRPVQDPDYFTMPEDNFEAMRKFYEVNCEVTFGIGEMRGGIWYSKSGVQEQQGIQMNINEEIQKLLKETGPGKMSSTAYDTAWVARLGEIDWN